MAVTYTTLKTENLGNDQERVIRGYEVTGLGTILNSIVRLTIKAPFTSDVVQYISDKEVFLPGVSLAALTGLSFTVLDTVTLDGGQKRVIREYTLYTGDKVVQVIRTQDYKQGTVNKSIVGEELLSYVPLAVPSPSKTPQGTWSSGTAVDFAARPGQTSTVRLVFPDGKTRSFSGTLAWRNTNNVADLGWDETSSQAAGDKWVYWYVVPKTNDDKLMTVVASDNPPIVGPTGRSTARLCWVAYREGGDIQKQRQNGNHFDHPQRIVYANSNISDESSYTAVSLVDYMPETASHIKLLHTATVYSTQTSQDRWTLRISASASDSDALNILPAYAQWDTQRSPREITSIPAVHTQINQSTRSASPSSWLQGVSDSFVAPIFGARTVYKKRDRVSGSSQNLWWNQLDTMGWVDEWIEP